MPGNQPPIEVSLHDEAPERIPISSNVVSLNQEAEREGLTVGDRIALQDAELRKVTAERIVKAFVQANVVILIALGALVILDELNVGYRLISPGDRIITSRVVMAFVGATTVQLGAIAVIIARYLFPSRSETG